MRVFLPPWCALPLLLASCLETEQTITIAADGSGTQHVRLSLSENVLAEVRRAAAVTPARAGDPLAVFDRAAVERELKAASLELKEYATAAEGGRRTVTLLAAFPSIDALRQSPLCGSAAEWELEAGPKPGTVRASLYLQGKAAWTDARAKAEAMRGAEDAVASAFFAKRRQQLAGLDVTLRLRLPGTVHVWTRNLEKTGDREVTARITAEEIRTPEDLVRRLAPRYQVVFDATGCTFAVK